MSKHVETTTSRLICFGGVKACTNAVSNPDSAEDIPLLGFPD